MKKKDVPQDNNRTFQGFGTKAVYALDENGKYTQVSTSGWDVEEIVLRDVVNDFCEEAENAKQKALQGRSSPLEYFMLKNFMDLELLAKGLGFFKWKVKRHMKTGVFNKLGTKVLQQYADFFNVSTNDLLHFKEYLKREQL